VKTGVKGTGTVRAEATTEDFYRVLNSELGAAPSFISRFIDTPDLRIVGGGEELLRYIEVNAAQGGITADQIRPNYTNLKGEDVYGIISCRVNRELRQIRYSEATFDSIINGQFTRNLNFIGRSIE
jgi:hypothetical protein